MMLRCIEWTSRGVLNYRSISIYPISSALFMQNCIRSICHIPGSTNHFFKFLGHKILMNCHIRCIYGLEKTSNVFRTRFRCKRWYQCKSIKHLNKSLFSKWSTLWEFCVKVVWKWRIPKKKLDWIASSLSTYRDCCPVL